MEANTCTDGYCSNGGVCYPVTYQGSNYRHCDCWGLSHCGNQCGIPMSGKTNDKMIRLASNSEDKRLNYDVCLNRIGHVLRQTECLIIKWSF